MRPILRGTVLPASSHKRTARSISSMLIGCCGIEPLSLLPRKPRPDWKKLSRMVLFRPNYPYLQLQEKIIPRTQDIGIRPTPNDAVWLCSQLHTSLICLPSFPVFDLIFLDRTKNHRIDIVTNQIKASQWRANFRLQSLISSCFRPAWSGIQT